LDNSAHGSQWEEKSNMTRSAFLLFVILLIALSSTAAGQEAASSAPASPSPSESADLVVLRISGRPITEQQVLNTIEELARQMKLPYEKLQQRNSLLFKNALTNLITIALLKDQIQQQNITVSTAMIDQQVSRIIKQYKSQEAYQKALAAQGLTESELRKNLEGSMGPQLVLERVIMSVPQAADAEIEKFYTDNTSKFSLPERAHALHIFLAVPSNSAEDQKGVIKKKLEGIRADIEAGVLSFADAAAKYSQDAATASKGGDLGTFPRGRKSFEDAAFDTKPGTLSAIVESPDGYHLIKTIDIKPAGQATLEESKESIKQYLEQNAKQTAKLNYIEELKSKARIESFMTEEEFIKRHPVE
jgi:parvulin-like peptidyl-prolyl isomerase